MVYTAYYPVFSQSYLGSQWQGSYLGLPIKDIPWTGITYLVHFAANETVTQTPPYTNVTVDPNGVANSQRAIELEYGALDINNATDTTCGYNHSPPRPCRNWTNWQRSLIDSAHAHGVKVLYDVHAVGSGGNTALDYVTSDQGRTDVFVNAVVSYVNLRGYDGVQVDWEFWSDWSKGPKERVSRLTRTFRTALGPDKVFIYAPGPFDWTRYDPALDSMVDQYCLQTYAYNPAWYGGSVNSNAVWYDSPLHKGTVPTDFGGDAFDTRGAPNWVATGHDPKKISLGIYSGSHVFKDVNALYQPYANGAMGEGQYKDAWQLLSNGGTLGWDDVRKVPYIYGTAINNQGNTWWGQPGVTAGKKFFASFEDSISIKNKIDWISQQGLGGLMVYNLTSDILDLRYGSNPIAGKTNPVHHWTTAALGSYNYPTGYFTASPTVFQVGGGTTTLTWTSNNATSASIDQGIGSVALNGSQNVFVDNTKIFTLTLTNSYGSRTYRVTVSVSSGTPIISGVTSSNITLNSATIQWTTNVPSNSQVEYGLTKSYGNTTPVDVNLVTSHSATIENLTPNTLYHYRVKSTEIAGYQAVSSDQTFTTAPHPPASTIRSDDFNSSNLNTSIWTSIDPLGDASLRIIYKNIRNGLLSIKVPAGKPHDIWTKGNNAPRIMQPANDTDFEIELKFGSAVTMKYQIQGVIIEEDSRNYLRLDFYSDGSATRVFAASFINGTPTARANRIIAGNGVVPLYMKVKRQGILWTQLYSFDGKTWTVADTFSHALKVTKVGTFIGNEGNPAPAFTGLIDYFFNTTSPIVSDVNRTE